MIIIKGITLHDGLGGVQRDVAIAFTDKIVEIGAHIKESKDDTVLTLKHHHVFPSFIDPLNYWGCIGPGWQDDDTSEKSDPVTPHLDIVDSFEPDNMAFQQLYHYGIGAAGISPGIGNVFGGKIAAFKTSGSGIEQTLIKANTGLRMSVSPSIKQTYGKRNVKPMTAMGIFALIREHFSQTQAYIKKDKKEHDLRYETLAQALSGKLPCFIHAEKEWQIINLLKLKETFGFKAIISGAYEITETLGKASDGIIMGDLTEVFKKNHRDINSDVINQLVAKGVPVAISSTSEMTASGKESLLWNALLYQKSGVDSAFILPMITSGPAKMMGLTTKGILKEGYDADLTVWTDNPFETFLATQSHFYSLGKQIDLEGGRKSCW